MENFPWTRLPGVELPPGNLREVRRIRRLAESCLLVALDPLEELLEVADDIVDAGLDVAEAREALTHRRDREILGLDVRELVPGNRRGHSGVGPRPHRVRRRDRPVARVLVVVDEDPLAALLLPPRGGDEWGTTLDLARESKRAPSYLG